MRKALVLASLVLGLAAALAVQTAVADSDSETVLKFDTMTTVVEPFTGSAHPVRGVSGGGLPWQLEAAHGKLRSDGRLNVKVEGLVLAERDPVPPAMQGTNPIPQFRAIVSCLTPDSPDTGENVMTDPVPASPDGDARIDTRVNLPEPCIAPIVFVTSPTGAWFATTGR
jgi:hypothetical protein